MDSQSYLEILERYYKGIATEEELIRLEKYADNLIGESKVTVFRSNVEKERIKQELRQRLEGKLGTGSAAIKVKQIQRNTWFRVAASIAIVSIATLSVWLLQDQVSTGDMVTVQTGVGERKTVKLIDGSVIELNAGSTLEYPKDFSESERFVKIEGEGYFTIAKDQGRPFEVRTQDISVHVLGTVFNVNAYSVDSLVRVSLMEGSVRVEAFEEERMLRPMQQFTYQYREQTMDIQEFDSLDVMAWQLGDLVFSKTTFAAVNRIIQRKYGVTLQFDKPEIADYTISGKFKNPGLTDLLTSICAVKSLEYKEVSDQEYLIYASY